MIFPIESLLTESRELGLVVALFVGFSFGFVLERAGFGRSTKLAAQFYFYDMTVLKVMFSAIVVAMLGLVIFGGLGLVNLDALLLSAASYTYVGPMIVGGLLLGAGFIISGYCPGTSIVAMASGNVDGLFTVVGVIIGSVLYGELYDGIATFASSGNLGHLFLPEVFGLPRPVVAVLVTAMAVGAFVGAEKLEKIFKRAEESPPASEPAPSPRARRAVFAAIGLMAVLGVAGLLNTPRAAASQDVEIVPMTVDELAHRLLEEPWTMWIIDLRERETCAELRIPGSDCVPADSLGDLELAYKRDQRDLVLVAASDLTDVPPEVVGYSGRVYALNGGFPSWERFAVDEPDLPGSDATTDDREEYAFRATVHGWLTGQTTAPPPPIPTASGGQRASGGGGCD